MVWLIVALCILLIAFYPVQVRLLAEAEKQWQVQLFWQPIAAFSWQIKLKTWQKGMAANKADQQGNLGEEVDWSDLDRSQSAPKEEKKGASWQFFWQQKAVLKQFLTEVLKHIVIKKLKFQANLAGNAAISAFGGGMLWTFLSVGLGALSMKVKRYPEKPQIQIGLNPQAPWQGEADIVVKISLGALLWLGIWLLGQWQKMKKNAISYG